MPDFFFWGIIAVISVGTAFAGGYMWRAFRAQRKELDLQHESWMKQQRLQEAEKANEAENRVAGMRDADVLDKLRSQWQRK